MTKMTEKVKSPCNELCLIDEETGYCLGCLRTSEEIAEWGNFSDEQKIKVLNEIEQRK